MTQAVQGHWSWREVGASVVSAGAGYYAGQAVSSVLQGAGATFTKVASNIAASAAGSWASSQVMGYNTAETRERLTQAFASGLAQGVSETLWKAGGISASGAVGNAIGDSIASSGQREPNVPPVGTAEEKAAILKMFADDAPFGDSRQRLASGGQQFRLDHFACSEGRMVCAS